MKGLLEYIRSNNHSFQVPDRKIMESAIFSARNKLEFSLKQS